METYNDEYYLNELKEAVDLLFNTECFVNNNRTVMVFDVDLKLLKEFVERSKFNKLVHSVENDYDYGYDEYCDPLTVAEDRVLLYCKSLCELQYYHECDNCGKCYDC